MTTETATHEHTSAVVDNTNKEEQDTSVSLIPDNVNANCQLSKSNTEEMIEVATNQLVSFIQQPLSGYKATQSNQGKFEKTEPQKRRYINWRKLIIQASIMTGLVLIGLLLFFFADPILGSLMVFAVLWYALYISKIL